MSDPVKIRSSSIASIIDCRLRGLSIMLGLVKQCTTTAPAAIGTACHEGTAVFDQAVLDSSPMSPDDAASVVVDNIWHPRAEINWGKINQKEAERRALGVFTRYCTDIAPKIEYEAVELPLTPLVVNVDGVEIELTGTLDRVYTCVNEPVYDGAYKPGRGILDIKGLALNTLIPTPTGWSTMGNICAGDYVFDAYGKKCKVVKKSNVKRIGTYKVKFDDGSEIICDKEHIWWVSPCKRQKPFYPMCVEDIMNDLKLKSGQSKYFTPVAKPLKIDDITLPVDPYLLGCWIGDGHKRDNCITKEDALFDILKSDGSEVGVRQKQKPGKEHVATRTIKGLTKKLRDCNLLHNKHIPVEYLRASEKQRLRLLQGLMDTDGTWNSARRRAVFSSVEEKISAQVTELLLTLGQKPHPYKMKTHGFGLDVIDNRVEFTPLGINPFRLERKAVKARVQVKNLTSSTRRVITSITKGPDVETACISVNSTTNTYLCDKNMIPTHNTGINAVSAKPEKHLSQIGTYELLQEHTTGQPITLPGLIGALQTSREYEVELKPVHNARTVLLGDGETKGLLEYIARDIKTGDWEGNTSSWLCSEQYCGLYKTCFFRGKIK